MRNDFFKKQGDPVVPGWYPVLILHDVQDGAMPGSSFWDGSSWDRAQVIAFGDLCESEAYATYLAYENDPDK